jgi:carbamoyl-phosphate synthase small subunit
MLRAEGAMEMIASTEIHNVDELKKMLANAPRIEEINYIEQVSTKESYTHNEARYDAEKFEYQKPNIYKKIIALDLYLRNFG